MLKKALFFISILSLANSTYGEVLENSKLLKDWSINGNLRLYYFTRMYANDNVLNQNAFSLGGRINITTPEILPKTRAILSLYTAQSLGLNHTNLKRVDNTLPGYALTILGQAFLQHQTKYSLVKLGNQLIDTPWVNPADSRMIPMTYQAIYGEFIPNKDLKFIGFHIFKFKDKTSSHFDNINLYKIKNNGVSAFSMQYKLGNITTQSWYYHYNNLANLFYLNLHYEPITSGDFTPIFGVQFLHEQGDGNNLAKSYAGGSANARGYGLLVGAKTETTQLSVGYNFIPTNSSAFHKGNILSPYTSGNDPLYTTSMIAGLIEKSPGKAIKITAAKSFFDKKLQVAVSHARYFTMPILSNTHETDLDVSYIFAGKAKGLTIRYRLGSLQGDQSTGRFIYNRLMLQYSF